MNQLPAPGQTDVGRAWDAGHGSAGGDWQDYASAFGPSAGNLLGGLLGGNSDYNWTNPADAAMPYLNKIPGALNQYLNPYIQAGQGAMGTLQGQYGNLLNDPSGMLSKFGKGFQEDPGYQYNLHQAEQGATNAAAAGGMAGTPAHQQQAAGIASNMANQQYQQYLSNVMGLYGQGLGGYQGLNQMGYGASNEMAQGLAQSLMAQGILGYQGQNAQNSYEQQQAAAKAANQNSWLSGLGGIAGGALGAWFGGPMGAMAGSKIGSNL